MCVAAVAAPATPCKIQDFSGHHCTVSMTNLSSVLIKTMADCSGEGRERSRLYIVARRHHQDTQCTIICGILMTYLTGSVCVCVCVCVCQRLR